MKLSRLPSHLPLLMCIAMLSSPALAESLYLTCKTTNFSGLEFSKAYKKVPSNPQDQFLQDALMEYDLIDVVTDRADSWEVNLDKKTISSPENNSGPVFTDAKVSPNKIEARVFAYGKSYTMDVNRITGKMTYTIYLAKDVMESWNKKHGGELPFVWKWEKDCKATKPKI